MSRSNKIQNSYQTRKKEKEEIQNEIQTNSKNETLENQELVLEPTSTYILKYTRKGDELKEISEETWEEMFEEAEDDDE